MAQTRDNCFDFLRFLLAFNIVFVHLIEVTKIDVWQPVSNWAILGLGIIGYASITSFFVISGYLIAQSYIYSSSIKLYFIKRAKRLLPAYWLVVLVCAFGFVFLSEYDVVTYFTSPQFWKYLMANLTFLNFIQPCLPGVFESAPFDCAVNGALWTLKIEVGFYLCVPIIIGAIKKVRKPWIVLLIIYILSVCYRNGLQYYADYTDRHVFTVLARQLPGFLSYFVMGMGIFLYKDRFLLSKQYLLLPALLLAVGEWYFEIEWFLPIAMGIIVIWCAYSLPNLNHFARYGDISYGMYIYHFPTIQIMLAIGCFDTMNVWIVALLAISIIILLSLLSWHGMEKRILQRK